MMRRLGDIRLLPIVLVAIIALFAPQGIRSHLRGAATRSPNCRHANAAEPEVTGAIGQPKRNDAAVDGLRPKAAPARGPQPPTQQRLPNSLPNPGRSRCSAFPDITGAVAESKSAPSEAATEGQPPGFPRPSIRRHPPQCRHPAGAGCCRQLSARSLNVCRSGRNELEQRLA